MTTRPIHVALIGDYSGERLAHRAIPRALALAAASVGVIVEFCWTGTRELGRALRETREYIASGKDISSGGRAAPASNILRAPGSASSLNTLSTGVPGAPDANILSSGREHPLAQADAVWCVPGSPYEDMDAALAAIRWAREQRKPFLGTCGGFQHALLEFARDVAGLPTADHTETNATASVPVVTLLPCSLVEQSEEISFVPHSLIQAAYIAASAREGYHCSYGLNPGYQNALEAAGLRFTAFDASGHIRGMELSVDAHPFFVGTLFQPERAALENRIPPLVRTFIAAAAACS